ncbi:MAG TPA: SurA N-terminal domain-containing protein, partial [Pseudodesulfovibrio sp.]|nr:SurA N-terminal domain-containing protein [Pseudodesulfovibrio sp.]
MLEFIRKYAQGFIAWVIFGMLILAFGLWGIQSYFSPTAANDVAKVNDEQITTTDLATATELYRARLRAMFGKNYNPEMFSEKMVQAQVLKSLIDQSVLTQAARDAGFRITDDQLGAEIKGSKQFQTGGKFNEKQYQMLLRNQGMSAARFERNVRRGMLIDQLNNGVSRTAFVTDRELKALVQLKDQKRDLGYVMVPAKRFMEKVKVSDAEIKKRYDENSDRFKTPAQVSVDYLDLSVDDLAKDVKPTDEQLHQYYQDHLAEFGTEEMRHASHILVAVPNDADAKAVAKAKAKAEDILKKVKAGQDFAELAKKYSDDPGSAKQGGDLGFFTKGDMAPAFSKAVFALKPGQVSGIVRTSFGFHIIKLLGVKAGKTKTFAQVKDQLANEYRHDKAEKRFYDMSEKLENLTYEHPNTLQDAAKALGLKIHSTGLFTRGDAKGVEIASSEKVRKAAFGGDVLNNDYNSLPINLTQDRVVVLRKKTYEAP